MEMKEWKTMDKSAWARGPWDDEPDKMQWHDAETGLPCLIVRGGGGSLCGYVGVAVGHPCYELGYNSESAALAEALEARKQRPIGENPGMGIMLACLSGELKASPEVTMEVHGGLTFSDFCRSHTPEQWEQFRKRKATWEAEAAQYPIGDAARRLTEWAECFDDYDAWVERVKATSVCHIHAEREPAKVWWLGFDCAHCDDHSPGDDHRIGSAFGHGTYRDVAYVQNECASLARQLAALA